MLRVKTPDEVLALIEESFSPLEARCESTALCGAVGRVLAEDICAAEFVPDFAGRFAPYGKDQNGQWSGNGAFARRVLRHTDGRRRAGGRGLLRYA